MLVNEHGDERKNWGCLVKRYLEGKGVPIRCVEYADTGELEVALKNWDREKTPVIDLIIMDDRFDCGMRGKEVLGTVENSRFPALPNCEAQQKWLQTIPMAVVSGFHEWGGKCDVGYSGLHVEASSGVMNAFDETQHQYWQSSHAITMMIQKWRSFIDNALSIASPDLPPH